MNARLTMANYEVEWTDTAESALDSCVRSRPNLVITDLRLIHMDGLSLLRELKSRWPALTVIIVTAHGTIAEAVQATQYGAFGFLVKPVEKSELLGQVERAIAASTFTLVKGDWRADIVSRSQLMEDRLGLANRAATGTAPVLLTGENGTGKELLARAIHAASPRRDRPFVAVRCKDRAEETLESELYGTRDTPAETLASGALAAARGGTLLLDEIHCLSPRLQAELIAALRGLPVSGDQRNPRTHTDARLISTTSRDLKKLMETGEFRQDLYYHISVLPIEIPPLGRRREDIPLLVSHFLEQATEDDGSKKIYTPEAIELLATTDWPGNVRQLFDLVKQNVALSHGKIMSKEFVERSLGREVKKVPTYDEARETFARDYLAHNLQATSGNVSQSARLAKRNRTDFYKLLARYRLEPDDFKNEVAVSRKKSENESQR
ncbi:MAG: response regulator GlrR [Gammaproteobacteria bacterium]|nr:response regulator GlrR [Gammaproteobacteria bacterium]